MDEVRSLTADSGGIDFEIGDDAWCQVFLRTAPDRRPLGAELFPTLLRKLLVFLKGRDAMRPTRQMDGEDWSWFLSLSELHSSLYARRGEGHWKIRALDADGKPIGDLVVDDRTLNRWIVDLEGWLGE
jgi:hypothetical protein